MNNHHAIKIMSDLCQLDIDAVSAYELALKHIDRADIHAKIDAFKLDHVRHIQELNALIYSYGGTPPQQTADFKGFLINGFTALRSLTGLEGALNAMESNEETTNKYYRSALEKNLDLPLNVKALLEKNYGDERSHLAYIKSVLHSLENVE